MVRMESPALDFKKEIDAGWNPFNKDPKHDPHVVIPELQNKLRLADEEINRLKHLFTQSRNYKLMQELDLANQHFIEKVQEIAVLEHKNQELQNEKQELHKRYNTVVQEIVKLESSTAAKNVARLEKENSILREDLEALQKHFANAHQHKAYRAHGGNP